MNSNPIIAFLRTFKNLRDAETLRFEIEYTKTKIKGYPNFWCDLVANDLFLDEGVWHSVYDQMLGTRREEIWPPDYD